MKSFVACRDPKWMSMDSFESAQSGHDVMRMVAASGESLFWCRKCSGHKNQTQRITKNMCE